MTGPTSFAPIIEMAITIVEQSGGQYHVLLIIADGQVTLQFIFLTIEKYTFKSFESASVTVIFIFIS